MHLLKEYIRKHRKVGQASDQSLSFNFYFHENIQLKIKFINKDGGQSVYMIFENIVEKISHGELNSKLSYTILLLNSLSHEMLTPLHHLLGVSGILLKQASINKIKDEFDERERKAYEGLRTVNQIALGMNITAKNTLDFANILNNTFDVKKKRFHVKDLFEYLLSVFSIKSNKKGLTMKYKCDERLEMISDYNRLAGLIYNFVENSVKFTQSGGVTLIAKLMKQGDQKHIVEFKIVDTGVGIEEIDLEKISVIFRDPFQAVRTSDSAGLGIGLRISQELLKRLSNGDLSIEISSEKGVGTTIRFEIALGIEEVGGNNSKIEGAFLSYMNVSCRSEVLLNEIDFNVDNRAKEFSKEREILNNPNKKIISNTSNNILSINDDELPGEHNEIAESPFTGEEEQKDSILEVPKLAKDNARKIISVHIKHRDTVDEFIDEMEENEQRISSGKLFVQGQGAKNSKFFNSSLKDNSSRIFGKRPTYKGVHTAIDKYLQSKKVALVVDDDQLNSEIAAMMLTEYSIEAHCALNGDIAIDFCCKYLLINKRIDIIFMDYNMPGMCGDEVTKILREERFDNILKNTVILGLTAQTDSETVQKCIESGMNRVESKPFDSQKIKELLKEFKLI